MNEQGSKNQTTHPDDMADEITPFRVAIPQSDLDELRHRLELTRWPGEIEGDEWDRGVPVSYLKNLTDYWKDDFDWRKQESRLNAYPQFTTEIDGQTIHFLHVRSPEPDAMPLIITNGWPSSFVEAINLIDPLTNPVAHGGDPTDAFDVIIPSLPGFGFSNPVNGPGGGNLFRVAQMWDELMNRLGYERYAAQGSDIGAGVTQILGAIASDRVIAMHVAGPAPFPFGPPIDITGLSGQDLLRAERFNQWQADGIGYLQLQATRPQTIAYALTDSPVGQLAWIVEKFREWTDPAADLPEDAVDRDDLLTNVSLYWFTRSGASSANAVYEGMQAYRAFAEQPQPDAQDEAETLGAPPLGVAVFAADNSIRSVLYPAGGPDHWAEFDSGGHFPGMETPHLLTNDVRTFFQTFR